MFKSYIATKKRNRFVLKGIVIYGSLTKVHDGTYRVSFWYSFNTPEGKLIDRHTSVGRENLRFRMLPKSGAVAISYINDTEYLLLQLTMIGANGATTHGRSIR